MATAQSIESEKGITNLFKLISRQKDFYVMAGIDGCTYHLEMEFYHKQGIEIHIKNVPDSLKENQEINIGFFFKESLLTFDTTVASISEGTAIINTPTKICSTFKRLIPRYAAGEGSEMFIFFPSAQQGSFKVADISTRGISFIYEGEPLQIDKIITNIRITLDKTEIFVDGVVRHCSKKNGEPTVGLRFIDMDWPTYHALFTFIFSKNHPNVKHICDFPIEEVYKLFDKSGYLALKPKEQMITNFLKMYRNLDKVVTKPQLSTSLVYHENDKPLSGASVLRIYNSTFLGQQLVSVPEARFNFKSKSEIYLGISNTLLNHPYFEYYLTYFDAGSVWHNELYNNLGRYINDESKFVFDTVQLFEFEGKDFLPENSDDGLECCYLTKENYDEFLEYCDLTFKPLIKESYAYNHKDLPLDEIKKCYNLVGLNIDRRIWKVMFCGKTLAFGVAEVYEDGLNMYNMLDSLRIHFAFEDVDKAPIIKVILASVVPFFKRFGKEEFLVLSEMDDLESKAISIGGLNYSHLLGRVVMNRQGGSEYLRSLMLSFR